MAKVWAIVAKTWVTVAKAWAIFTKAWAIMFGGLGMGHSAKAWANIP